MKQAILVSVVLTLLASAGWSQSGSDDLQKQIEQLKEQIRLLEEKVNASQAKPAPAATPAPAAAEAPATQAETAAKTAELDARVEKLENKTAGNSINWGAEMRTRLDSVHWTINPYQQFMGTSSAPVPMPQQKFSDDMQYSLRLRLKMNAKINENLQFMGRLSMYKLYGGSDVPIFNGFPGTVLNSFNSSRIPSNEILRVERALLKWETPHVPLTVAFGRMNSSDGPPLELREGSERQGTPLALMVNAEVDGMHIDYHLDKIGFPEVTTIGVCGGIGYESGFGGGGQVAEDSVMTPFGVSRINGMRDSRVVGWIFDMPLLFQTGSIIHSAQFMAAYNRFTNMTDIPYGALRDFPIPGAFAFPTAQFVTATNNLGNMNQWGMLWKHGLGDNFTYFTSVGYISSDPNGRVSQYGFGGLLGDPMHSKNAWAVYTGAKYTPVKPFSLGLEFNHGSPRWFAYTPDMGDPSSKLAARGDVWEVYSHWNFVKNLFLRAGYINYNFSTAFSGWHIAPGDLDYFSLNNPSAVNFYPFPKKVKNLYFMIEAKF